MPFNRIGIIGVGLLGGSIGLAAKSAIKHCKIAGYDNRTQCLERAVRGRAIDQVARDLADAVAESDLVILCTPVSQFGAIIGQISDTLLPQAVVTDVGSTKQSIVQLAGQLSHAGRFVGSHPMAGGERGGIENARPDLLKGAVCITTPVTTTDPSALADVEEFWKLLGMRVSRLSPQEHDRIMAEVSHLPHAVAAALVSIQSQAGLSLCGPGFRDATRIAGGDPDLWRDIFLDNQANLLAGIALLRGELDQFTAIVEKGDANAIRDWLAAAAKRRNSI